MLVRVGGVLGGTFRRVLIASECKEKTLRFLSEQKQVNAGTIFPDVEGLGKFLHWHLQSLLTTLFATSSEGHLLKRPWKTNERETPLAPTK